MTTHHPSTEATGTTSAAPRAGWWGRAFTRPSAAVWRRGVPPRRRPLKNKRFGDLFGQFSAGGLGDLFHGGAVVGADLVRHVTEAEAASPVGPCLLPAAHFGEAPLYLGNGNEPSITPWMVEALTEAAFRMEGGEDFPAYANDCGAPHLQRVVEGAFALSGVPLGFIERRERAILVTYRTLRALGFA